MRAGEREARNRMSHFESGAPILFWGEKMIAYLPLSDTKIDSHNKGENRKKLGNNESHSSGILKGLY